MEPKILQAWLTINLRGWSSHDKLFEAQSLAEKVFLV